MKNGQWGNFPFGQPNTERQAREATRADAVVVGVYPSAWHVEWSAPNGLKTSGLEKEGGARKGHVAALAVDVEPTVFWDGKADDFGARLAGWKRAVGFIEGKHGAISPISPSTNGSSGGKVVKHYLDALGLKEKRVAFTDVYPVFLVKGIERQPRTVVDGDAQGDPPRREQGDAIRDEYNSIAPELRLSLCTLPPRISNSKLPALAAAQFGERLLRDLAKAESSLLITLGKEVWETLRAIPALDAKPPVAEFEDLYGDSYGKTGEVTVSGRKMTWLPLVHPGLLKGKVNEEAALPTGPRTIAGWVDLHARWAATEKARRK